MIKIKHFPQKQNTINKNSQKLTSQNQESAKIKDFNQVKIKVKLFTNHKKENSKLNNSLLLDTNRIKRKYQVLQCSENPKSISQTKRKLNQNNNEHISKISKPFALSAEKRKINNTLQKAHINNMQIDKNNINIKKFGGNSHFAKENKIKIRKMNMNINISRFSNAKEKLKRAKKYENSLSVENRKTITTSLANNNNINKPKNRNIKEKEKDFIKKKLTLEKSLDKLNMKHIKKPYNVKNVIKKNLKKNSEKLNNIDFKLKTDNDINTSNISNGNNNNENKNNINKEIKSHSNSVSSNTSGTMSNSSENDSNSENKKIEKNKLKRNITDLSPKAHNNKSKSISTNKNEIVKIIEFKPQSQETKKEKKQNNIFTSNNRYLRRRSVDNPDVRERLEQYVNNIMLKQNGGNTLFLTNYESGPSYEKNIQIKIKEKQNIIKKIKIGSCTKPGCSGPGIVKTNQDNYFIKFNFLNNENYYFLGICDGHGEDGHQVSKLVSKNLPSYITSLLNDDIISSFEKINSEIYSNNDINSNMSGTTVVSVIITPEKLISINLGDSRLSLFKYDNGIYYSKNLSREHKPSEIDEKNRIISNGGRIQKCFDENTKKYFGPERVWLKNKEEPGLAMTRSLGDKTAHQIGVISQPEIKNFYYDGTEKFIIIASDGLWEYIKSEQCINIVKKYYEEEKDTKDAALELTKEAFKRWKRKETVIDDITIIVIFFY